MKLAGALLGAGLLFVSVSARADLGPPKGEKSVGFGFLVTGLAATPDIVLFAYPCGGSDGAPIAEHQKIVDKQLVSVGRRGGGCAIYAISKSAYDDWAKSYQPTRTSSDPALTTLVGLARSCQGAPSPAFTLPSSDPRPGITETLTVKMLDAKSCELTSAGIVPATTKPAPSGAPASPSPSAAKGCDLGGAPVSSGLAPFAFAALALGALRRRRLLRLPQQ